MTHGNGQAPKGWAFMNKDRAQLKLGANTIESMLLLHSIGGPEAKLATKGLLRRFQFKARPVYPLQWYISAQEGKK